MNVKFCPSCRGLILADFRFCPYCGAAVKGPELAEALDGPFAGMAAKDGPAAAPTARSAVLPARSDIFASAEESLQRLEADMDLILEALEKEGRHPT